ncbi:hypothetical protein QE152_g1280 [Popillia japonica]|uniref:Uncharacterized protein n=1 Tax=Popillia japonica TaxID=7064 RepID=A0AAW1NBH4_POPJA
MATSIEFYYINIRNEIDKGQINIPAQAEVVGSCGEGDRHRQSIKLLWYFNSLFANTLELVFRRNSHMYELDKVILNVTLDSADFPTAKDTDKTLILINKNMHFLTPENRSYKCTKPHTLSLHQQRGNVDIGKMKIMHLHFQAFGNITNGHLAKAMDCKPHHTSRSLFILLGAVTILFVILLVTYMIIRARHPIHGYSIVDKAGNRCESDRVKLCLQSEGIPPVSTNVQIITEKEINLKMPYNSVKLLMKKFGRN